MQDSTLRILIVEDDRLQARALGHLLGQLGYDVLGTAATALEAMIMFESLVPDLVLLDIRLHGEQDGVDVALQINARRPVPLIFLTSYPDRVTFERAKQAGPFAFLSKPYEADVLAHSIELAVQHFARSQGTAGTSTEDGLVAAEALFVRENGRLLRIAYNQICWAEAAGSYLHVHTTARKFTLRISLRELEEKLPAHRFVRVHRGYLVQAIYVDRVDMRENQVWVQGQPLTIGRAYREELLNRLNLVG